MQNKYEQKWQRKFNKAFQNGEGVLLEVERGELVEISTIDQRFVGFVSTSRIERVREIADECEIALITEDDHKELMGDFGASELTLKDFDAEGIEEILFNSGFATEIHNFINLDGVRETRIFAWLENRIAGKGEISTALGIDIPDKNLRRMGHTVYVKILG